MTNNITKTSVYFTKAQSKITLVFNLIDDGIHIYDCNIVNKMTYLQISLGGQLVILPFIGMNICTISLGLFTIISLL